MKKTDGTDRTDISRVYSYNRRRIKCVFVLICAAALVIAGRLTYIMVARSTYYSERAKELHERERSIKAPRGKIYDRNGNIIADNKAVCSISVIHSQIEDEDEVIAVLDDYLDKSREEIEKKVKKVSSREVIASNVDKETGRLIKAAAVAGIKVDEDYKRSYPYDELASKVIGFTGGDNQGVVGMEVTYDSVLTGTSGSINAVTDAKGIELAEYAESRKEAVAGDDVVTTLDINIQRYVTQAAYKVLEEKKANRVCAITINPQNGEIYAMADVPEYNLNDPFTLVDGYGDDGQGEDIEEDSSVEALSRMELLNSMWRNYNISDTYEPGSTAKIITLTAALETNAVSSGDTFYCPGYRIVEDRRIRCAKTTGHGSQKLAEALMNSCNPAFMEIGERTGVYSLYEYYDKLGLFDRSGIDLPGEANSIMHAEESVGPVELATMSFGQSFQLTPIQFVSAVCTVVNGGHSITPHIGKQIVDSQTGSITAIEYEEQRQIIGSDTSEQMQDMLEAVVAEGSGKNGYIEGYSIGGKTATSEKLPRGNGRYISSFIGFAPAENPCVLTLLLIDEPEGTYYGGTVAAPVVRDIFSNILPYLGVEQDLGIDKAANEY